MLSFRNLSLRYKQTLIMMLTSSIVLLLACVTFSIYEVITFRRELVQSTSVLADAIGNTCAAAIDFNDPQTAVESLSALQADPEIIGACVYTKSGGIFASYDRANDDVIFTPPALLNEGHTFYRQRLILWRPIIRKGEAVGVFYLESDMRALFSRLKQHAGIVGVVFLTSLLLSFMLSNQLQRLVSDPILRLAQVARSVAVEKNYSVRATRQSNDELGLLVDGFNEMLGEIQERDFALEAARDTLEFSVKKRTQELASSVALLNATLEASADGILAVDRRGRITSCNRKFVELWEFPAGVVARHDTEEMVALAASQLDDPDEFLALTRQVQIAPETETHDVIRFKDGRIFERVGKSQYIGDLCVGSVLTFRDITERKRADERLRRTEELYRSAITGAGAVPYSYDFRTQSYAFMGEGIQQLIGYAPHQVNGQLWKGLIQKSIMLGEAAGVDKDEAAERVKAGDLRHWRCDMLVTTADGKARWISDASVQNLDESGRVTGSVGILQDITERKDAEAELERTHRQLLDISRAAGMAEVATSVLHNVGNVLNSVNTSASMVMNNLKSSKADGVSRVVELLEGNRGNLAQFLSTSGRVDQVINFLKSLDQRLAFERKTALKELQELNKNIEHIKEIVVMQQSYARISGVTEKVKPADLVEAALRMNAGALGRHGVELVREYDPGLPEITVEKHKVLQILVNLIRNAKYACDESGKPEKQMRLRLERNDGASIRISVIDNGVGIPPENLTCIFAHGFTTRKDGHGFGLHSGALAAKELGGSLTVHSDGSGRGASFTLELPQIPRAGDTTLRRRTELELPL